MHIRTREYYSALKGKKLLGRLQPAVVRFREREVGWWLSGLQEEGVWSCGFMGTVTVWEEVLRPTGWCTAV